jgi:hypothetical protein
MATIIGVLSFYNGKEIPHWKSGITLDGFIAIFSGLAKGALLLPTAECIGQLKWSENLLKPILRRFCLQSFPKIGFTKTPGP